MNRLFTAIVMGGLASSTFGAGPVISEVTATRDAAGAVIISGKTQLPPGCRLMVDLLRGNRLSGQVKTQVSSVGTFKTQGFTNGGRVWPAGEYAVRVTSYFNAVWQQPATVISKTGKDGKLLSGDGMIPNDKEFPDQGQHLEATFEVVVPDLSAGQTAIEAVKSAKLNVTGKGLPARFSSLKKRGA